ncbi:cytochrome P450 [Daedalea quercina L-15889]|uniref:Cytochrome P450 n=1 Tax=Daedalea quercina L-15889 TaxID=1314783 RepID=A0A165PLX6_9APHY|nr:cytochrome P450 [Daedalea quercina L-15889]
MDAQSTSLVAYPTLVVCKLAAVVGFGILLWNVVTYIRLRISLLAVSKIPGPRPQSFWSGNLTQLIARDGENFQQHIAVDYGPVTKLNGFFGEPILYVSDPKALHTILIKEENAFQEGKDFLAMMKCMFGNCLSGSTGEYHVKQRKMLNPVFSVKHMRHMLPLFWELGHKFQQAVEARVRDGPQELDMLAWLGRVALELIGQGALGYSFDPLVTDKADSYADALKSLVPELDSLLLFRKFITLSEPLPGWLRRGFVRLFPQGTRVHTVASIINTLDKRSKEIYADKKHTLEQGDTEMEKQVAAGKDIMSILLRANAAADPEDRLADEEVISQMSLFIVGGLDTTASALSRVLMLLAEDPQRQQKLRQELLDSRAADGLPYDELNRLPFLDAVVRETLRLYPPGTIIFRMADKDTVLPLSEPIHTTDGKIMDAVPVTKGSQFLLGYLGCNLSKSLWGEDALEWNPERWMSLPTTVTQGHIPGAYSNIMTFSGGKRACIGFKFSEMEMKVVLAVLLSKFTFEMGDQHIVWNVASVWYPSIGRKSTTPELPLKVGLYNPSVD